MNRKLTGLLTAVVLALVGTVMLVGYVRSAEARALSGEELVEVFVVKKAIKAGTPAEAIATSVTSTQVPAKVRATGAIDDLDDVKGLVTTVSLLPGEQVVKERFAGSVSRVAVPAGLHEVTVRLDPERAVGGELRAGDTVAVLSSFDPFDIDTTGLPAGANAPKKTPNSTHMILHKVLITNVQVSTSGARARTKDEEPGDEDEAKPVAAPNGTMLVTLALDAASVQQVVFTAEHGTLWLSAEPSEAPEGELLIETRGSIYR